MQPAEPLELWDSPPFEPTVRDGKIFARGSVDDKGQLFLHVKALEAHLTTRGKLPVNIIVLAEGEEEVGSDHLAEFIEAHAKELLACDAVVISDSAMFAPGLPSILSSLRGLAYFQIDVRGPATDLHSGSYGGAVMNPAMALARILATMHDADGSGHIAIDGFYDDVRDWGDVARRQMKQLPFDEKAFREETGSPELFGEKGYTDARAFVDASDMRGERPAQRLHRRRRQDGAARGGDGEGELPPRSRPASGEDRAVDARARRTRRSAGRRGDRPPLHGGNPWRADLAGPLFDAARRALATAFDREPVITGEGGSIPVVGDFQRILNAPVLLVGFGLPGRERPRAERVDERGEFLQGNARDGGAVGGTREVVAAASLRGLRTRPSSPHTASTLVPRLSEPPRP